MFTIQSFESKQQIQHFFQVQLLRVRQIFTIIVFLTSLLGKNTIIVRADSTGLVCETFESLVPGSTIGTYAGWYDGGAGPVVTAGNGVASSVGVATANSIFNWTAHPFNWNAADFQKITLQGDFQTSGSGGFDDDRLSWTTAGTSTSSNNQFGVQLDPGGIVTYWSNVIGNAKVNDVIVPLSGLTASAWYRFTAEITKLTATSAKIDVSLVLLDASGNPTGTPYTGSIADTSALASGHTPAAGYFSPTTMVPSYKNFNSIAGATDNLCYEFVTATMIPTVTVTGTLTSFASQPGVASAEQSYTVAGSNLTDNIVITAPTDFQISTTSGSGFGSLVTFTQSGGTVASTPIYVRFNRATVGTSSGTITHASTGATTQNLAVSGTATESGTVTFAAFGDYGSNSSNEQAVTTLVNGWNPDFIITTGDNSYGSTAIDENIGKYYSSYIGNYVGSYGSGSATDRFFPSLGNHDYTDGGGSTAYFNYFTLPNNERYYDFVRGPVHFFVIDSNPSGTGSAPGDGRSPTSAQGTWLQAGLAASTLPWKIVYMHHPPYSSGSIHGSETAMQWPYEAWGATAVLAGHDHTYERVMRDDNSNGTSMPYFVTGAGGMSLYTFNTPVTGSAVCYSSNYGSMKVQATATNITFEFWSVAGSGTLIDSYTIDNSTPAETLPINTGSTWKYIDNGTDQGTAWTGVAFDDTTWASGPAELGYGDGGEATVVDCSAVANCNTDNYITTYFRKTFNVPDASIYSGLNLRLLRDDGAIVYLNGSEIWRTNMPTGTVTYTTLATAAIGGADETTYVNPTSMLANTLVNGKNVLAVEIHQQAITSTDISFDLELTGVTAPTCYALTLGHTGNGTTPTATPANSTGCSAGQYISGETIALSGATPDSGWQIASWYGTSNNTSTANTNSLTMPANALSAGVNYTAVSTGNYALQFNGSSQYVTFGTAGRDSLGLSTFTLELWFKRTGAGTTVTSGTGGVVAVPLLTKGRGEGDGATVDMNYFLGIRPTDNVLVADFEDMASGGNHPIAGITAIPYSADAPWHHAAVTYNGTKWQLFLDGNLESELTVGQTPRYDSIQYAALGASLNSCGQQSGGSRTGYTCPTVSDTGEFAGVLDEARIWNVARTQAEIVGAMNLELTSGTGLIGRWGMNENSGTIIADSTVPAVEGTLVASPVWIAGAPFNITPPAQYTLTVNKVGNGNVTLSPAGGTYYAGTVVQLTATADSGWTFGGWSGDLTGSTNPTTITMNGNKTATATFTSGGTVTFQEGVNSYLSTVDTHIRQLAPTTDYGSSITLEWDSEDGTAGQASAKYALLRFDNIFGSGAGQIPAGSTITSATLQYVVSNVTTNAASNVNEVLVDWTEATTYNTFGSAAGVQTEDYGTLVTTAPATALTTYTINVTSSLAAWSGNPTSNRGWIIIPAGTDGVQVASGENGTIMNRPKLTVTYSATPTTPPDAPSALAAITPLSNQIHLAWTDNSNNETGFELERSTTGIGGAYNLLTTVSANIVAYDNLNLTASQEYCYRVRAVNSFGQSSYAGPVCAIPTAPEAFDFGTGSAYVTLGNSAPLQLAQFTLETWFKREGNGTTANTGSGGFLGIPLITKGVGEAENSNVDMNYFLGIRDTDDVICADFEEGAAGTSPGLNHPVCGTTVISNNIWYHIAATYDGSTWNLYLNGMPEATLNVGQPVRSDSIQHAGLGVALNSSGTASGHLDGVLDEARVWNYARTQAEIRSSINSQITTSQTDLVARWALDDGGTTVAGSAGTTVNGTVTGTGYNWIAPGAPFNINLVPAQPALIQPLHTASGVSTSPTLEVTVSDPDSATLNVTFYGRVAGASAENFRIVVLPDTQNYSASYPATFTAQTQWIVTNKDLMNIVYVAHEGDIVNDASVPAQWTNADNAMDLLDAANIPYGVVPGNHDEIGGTTNYNNYFGVNRFCTSYPTGCKSFYGGSYPAGDNQSNYTLFTAGGMNFIVINLDYTAPTAGTLDWADGLLKADTNRRGIVISHDIVGTGNPASFSTWGQSIYTALSDNPNLFLMMNGHTAGEGQRKDGNIYSLLADYQNYTNGGNGYLRIMEFSPLTDTISIKTYSPTLGTYETDTNSEFTLTYDMDAGAPFVNLGTDTDVPSGTNASITWPALLNSTQYEWYAVASDGIAQTTSGTWNFTTQAANTAPVADDQNVNVTEDVSQGITLTATDAESNPLTYSIVDQPAHGTLTGTGVDQTYTPAANYNGPDSFTFKANDGSLDSNTATVSITVTAVNDAPVAVADSYTTAENTQLSVTAPGVFSNDSDVDNVNLEAIKVDEASHGTASFILIGSGAFSYVPHLNFNGTDSFTYKLWDGEAYSNTVTVTINVTSVNNAPVCSPVSLNTAEDTNGQADPLCTDADGDTLTYSIVGPATSGNASVFTGTLAYEPNLNFNGSDSFTYRASDGSLFSDPATVTVTVTPVNDAPVLGFVADQDMDELALLSFTATASDVDNDPLTFSLNGEPTGAVITTGGAFTWTPTEAQGPGTYNFDICVNGGGLSDCQTIQVTVAETNIAPVLDLIGAKSVNEGSLLTFTATASDADIPANTLTFSLSEAPAGASIDPNTGVFTWTPTEAQGPDSNNFDLNVSDGITGDFETITVTINEVNTAPVAVAQAVSTPEDTALNITLTGTDVDLPAYLYLLTYTVVSGPSHGALSGFAPDLTYIPETNFNGSDSFTFKVNDGIVDSNEATVTITVNDMNDAPVAMDDSSYIVSEDSTLIIPTIAGVLNNDSDADSDPLTAIKVTEPAHGSVTLNSDGSFTYTPALNYHGADSFTYKANDSLTDSNTATVMIAVTMVNDIPVITEGVSTSITMSEGGVPVAFELTLHATDTEDDTLTWSISAAALHGTASATGTGATKVIGYTTDAGFNGSDSFDVQVSDGNGGIATITVNVTVDPVSTISGTIRDRAGNPITGIAVQVRAVLKSDGSQVALTTSNPLDGTYLLTGLPFNTALAVVASDENPEADGYSIKYFNNVNSLAWAQNILFTSGSLDPSGVDIKITIDESIAAEQLTFNVRPGRLLNDVNIRRAIAYGTDRQFILDNAFMPFGNTGEILNVLVAPTAWYAAEPADLTIYNYNQTTAQDILVAAGWTDTDADGIRENASNEELALDFITTQAQSRVLSANLFKTQMLSIGIRVNVFTIPGDIFFSGDPATSRLAAGDFDIAEFAWILNDSYDELLEVYNTANPQNLGGYTNTILDNNYNEALAGKVVGNLSAFSVNALLWQQTFANDLPALPMFTRNGNPIPTFTVQPDHGWVNGNGWTTGRTLTLTVDNDTDPGNGTLHTETQTVAGDGSVQFNVEPAFDLVAGQYVTLSDVPAGGTTTKSQQIAEVYFDSVNETTEIAAGRGPANRPASVYVRTDTNEYTVVVMIGSDGNWTADFGGLLDIQNLQDANVQAYDTDGDGTMAHLLIPSMDVWFKNGYISAYNWPLGTQLTLTVDDPSTPQPTDYTAITDSITAPWDPKQTVGQFNLNGAFVILPGMTITVSGGSTTKELVVSNLTITNIDLVNDTITGGSEPNQQLWMWFNSSCCRNFQADGSGVWSVDYRQPGPNGEPIADIKLGSSGTVNARDIDGDNTSLDWNIPNPYIEGSVINDWIHAREWPNGTMLTLTIDDPSDGTGDVDYSVTGTMGQAPWNPSDPNDIVANFNLNGFDVKPGDILKVADGAEPPTERTYTLTNLEVTNFNLNADTISGIGEPGVEVQVCVNIPNNCVERLVTPAAGTGLWTVDYSGAGGIDLVSGSNGWAAQRDANGNQTWLDWNVPNPRIQASPDGDWVQAHDWPIGELLTLTISGHPTTYEVTVVPAGSSTLANFQNLDGYDLHAGDVLTVTDNGSPAIERVYTVTNLNITSFNLDADTISGTANTGEDVDVCVSLLVNCVSPLTVTPDPITGDWTANFSGIVDLKLGDDGWASQRASNGNETWIFWRVPTPRIQASPDGDWVQAYDWPIGELLTLTISGHPTTYEVTVVPAGSSTLANFQYLGGYDLHAGDVLTVTDNGSPAIERVYTVTNLNITSFSLDADTISGTANVGEDVEICVNSPMNCVSLTVTPDPITGDWTANYSGLVDLKLGDEGWAAQRASSGNETWIYWRIPVQSCYNLTLSHTGEGSNASASPSNSDGCAAGTYIAGELIQLSGATANTGWQIGGWTGTENNSSTASTNTVMMPANEHVASVTYTQIEYTLNVTIVGNGAVTKSPDQATYHYGDTLQLSALADAGWLFSAWSGDATGSTSPVSVTIDGNKNVTATFTEIPPACTGILYVDVDSTTVTPNGCSWSWAFRTLQDALAAAPANGTTIWVAEGTYYPDEGTGQTNNARTGTFTLENGVSIYGGFAGNETLLSQRDPSLRVTTLSGDIDQVTGNANNAYHVVSAYNLASSAVLDGFTITGGNANSDGTGGGLYNQNGSPALRNLIFTANASSNFGGGMYSITSGSTDSNITSPTLTNVTFTGNTAVRGGGLVTMNSNAILTDVAFTNNTATGGAGGGMNNQTASTSNPASVPVLTNVTFNNNTANGGGGLYNANSNPLLTNVTMSGNTANVRGGGMLNEGASPTLKNVTISGNTAPAGTGGAIRNIIGVVPASKQSNPLIQNSILWGNNAGGGADEITSDGTGITTISYSVLENDCQPAGSVCTDIVIGDPLLGALANHGGFTQTIALGVGSSAIDAGNTATCATTDQRGITRPQGAACDAGAYEVVALTNLAVTPVIGEYGGTATLIAILNYNSSGLSGKTIDFTLNGSSVGSAVTDASGVATLDNVSLAGITAGAYPAGATASFAGDASYASSNGTADLTVNKATPVITWANPADIVQGTPLSATQSNATASVAGTFVYNPPAGTVLDAGNGQTLLVDFTPDDAVNYNNASADVTINVYACFALTLGHTGQGADPVADPVNSAGCPAGTYRAGEAIQLSGATPDLGWHISGWTGTDNDASTASTNSLTMPASVHTATINYAQNEYALTVVSAHGTVTKRPDKGTYNYGDVVTLSLTPDAGWTFTDWTPSLTDNTVTITGNTTVTANFTQNEYTLNITTVGNGTVTKNPSLATYTYGTIVGLTPVPDDGWTFAGWSGDASGSADPLNVTMDGNKNIIANFTSVSIILNAPAGELTSWNNTFSWTGFSTTTSWYLVQVQTLDGTTILQKWSTADAAGCAGNLNCTIAPYETLNLANGDYQWRILDYGDYGYGSWTPFTNFNLNAACYALTTDVLPAGSGTFHATAQNCSGGYIAGTVVQLTAVPITGYVLDSWSGDAIGIVNPVSITMDANKNVTANLTALGATLIAPAGALTSWNNTFSWTGIAGASWYLVQAQTNDDIIILQKWYTADAAGCAGDLSCVVSPDETLTLANGDYKWRILDYGDYGYGSWTPYANFNLNAACYTLTTNVLPAGSGTFHATAQNCSGGYIAGTVVQLTAIPNSGYGFASWSGDTTGTSNPVSVTMDADKNVTANMLSLGATLIAPAGEQTSWNNTFSWTGINGASWYLVQVQAADDSMILQKWFTVDAADCSGDLNCVVSPEETLTLANGDYKWRILDYGDYGYGSWTPYTDFNLNAACYTLTTNVLPAGSGTFHTTAQNCSGGYIAGTVVQLTVIPNSGYSFASWSGDATGTSNPVLVTMGANKSVIANMLGLGAMLIAPTGTQTSWDNTFSWTGIDGASWYLIQVQTNDDTVILQKWYTADAAGCSGDLSCAVSPEETLTLANGDYKWRILDYGDYGYGSWSIYKDFSLNTACYTLTTDVLPMGSGTVTASTQNCSGGYIAGTVVQVSVVPNSGYAFTSWSGDAAGTTNPVSITMDTNKSATANLTALGATLIAPAGSLTSWDNTFSWTGVTGATWYLVQVQAADDTVILQKWYTADAAGCSGDLSCAVSPEETLNLSDGDYKWRILDYGDYGYGNWSPYTTFVLNR